MLPAATCPDLNIRYCMCKFWFKQIGKHSPIPNTEHIRKLNNIVTNLETVRTLPTLLTRPEPQRTVTLDPRRGSSKRGGAGTVNNTILFIHVCMTRITCVICDPLREKSSFAKIIPNTLETHKSSW